MINNMLIEENPVDIISIYKGCLANGLKNIENNKFDWHKEYENNGLTGQSLTLNEIYTQAVKIGLIEKRGILTVFIEKPQHGKIYQCGNHEEGEWEVKGKTKGMHEIKLVINIGDGLLC